ncbi:hypothetical protein IT575_08165 [bacterium]|nr:hypothetical protein [bacterium]
MNRPSDPAALLCHAAAAALLCLLLGPGRLAPAQAAPEHADAAAAASAADALGPAPQSGDPLLDAYFSLIFSAWREDLQECDAVIEAVKDFYGLQAWAGDEAALSLELERLSAEKPLPPELEERFMHLGDFSAVLSREGCDALARQFPDDPRVYELLFEMEGQRWLDDPESEVKYWELDRDAYRALAAAAAAGRLRPQGLLLLTRLLSFTREDYVESQLAGIAARLEQRAGGLKGQPGYEAALAAMLEEEPELRRSREELQAEHSDALAILASSGMDAEGIYRRVTELAPDWAEGWYLLAEHEQRSGRSEEALAALRRGNSATELFSPLSFPMEAVDPLARSGRTDRLGPLYFPLRLAYSRAEIYAYDTGWWGLRALLDQAAAPQQKLDTAQELHRMLIRRARMSGPALHPAQLCLIVEGKLQSKIQEQLAADFNQESLEELRGLHDFLRAYNNAYREFQEQRFSLEPGAGAQQEGTQAQQDSAAYSFSGAGMLQSMLDLYAQTQADVELEQQFSTAQISPLLDELERFDYRRLGLQPLAAQQSEAARPATE